MWSIVINFLFSLIAGFAPQLVRKKKKKCSLFGEIRNVKTRRPNYTDKRRQGTRLDFDLSLSNIGDRPVMIVRSDITIKAFIEHLGGVAKKFNVTPQFPVLRSGASCIYASHVYLDDLDEVSFKSMLNMSTLEAQIVDEQGTVCLIHQKF